MNPIGRVVLSLAALLGVASLSSASAQTPGQVPPAYAACAACHLPNGANGLGPSLNGVYGRKAGAAGGFTFSRAMRNAAVTWDEKSLDAFLAEPQKAIPGNVMPFAGVPDAAQRAEIIAYLKAMK